MSTPHVAPYGSWKSPITPEILVASAGWARGVPVHLDGDDIYWVEPRPTEGGRYAVRRRAADGQVETLTPAPFNVRTRVHEYGGGALAVHDKTLYFTHDADQRVYRQDPGSAPRALTPAPADGSQMRYADLAVDARRGRIIAVREEHPAGGAEAVNTLVTLPLSGESAGEVIVSGADFYAFPALSPDGSRLAWIAWNHPNMPWDGTELWVAEVLDDGSIGRRERIAGGPDESIFQPAWSPDGDLYFVSDRTGFWNLYRHKAGEVTAVCPMEAEFGVPLWVFGMSTYGFLSSDRLFASFAQAGRFHLGIIDVRTGKLDRIETSLTEINFVRAANGRAVFCAGGPTEPTGIAIYDPARGRIEVVYRPPVPAIDPADLSVPEAISYPSEGATAHAFYYRPKNREFSAPPGEKPPLMVISHGGPTGAASTVLSPAIQFWTSRGIAVLDVNYGGSTGYGRAYRLRLDEAWGVVDVDDCANGARHLVKQGLVDGDRLIIRGGSAGGYTTLAALTFRDVFKAGASYYGIGELWGGPEGQHKFESRYSERLLGRWPEKAHVYRDRSPINFPDRLSCPVIFFQGLEDKVVPAVQAEKMVAALRARKLPVAYLPFEGEQHGFRRAENIKRSILAELYFYSKIFGFELAEPVDPVEIENLG